MAGELSDAFEDVARAEADRLRVRAAELWVRAERWTNRAAELTLEAARLEARLQHLDEVLGRAPQLRLETQTNPLRGQRLREEAVRILVEGWGTREPIHYREWYRLLRDAGSDAAGREPLATFLTEITRSPLVERVAGRRGVYRVDPVAAVQRARERLAEATRDLARAQHDVAHEGSGELSDAQLALARDRLQAAQRHLCDVLSARSCLVRGQLAAA